MISALVLVLAAASTAPATGESDYTMCMEVYAVKYGGENTESVDTILKLAKAECSVLMRQVERDSASNDLIKRETGLSLGIEKERVIERAEGAAIKALLKARAPAKPPK